MSTQRIITSSQLTAGELQRQLSTGEDSRHQFKRDIHNSDKLATELAAFANSGGGVLYLGVDDDGSISGLTAADVRRLNQLLGNASSQHVRPALHPMTTNVTTSRGIVMVIEVPDGLAKPYVDNSGRIWVKQGADKRHVTSREELQRMFQRAGLVYADVVPVAGTSMDDLDEKALGSYLSHRYGKDGPKGDRPSIQVLQNIGLADGVELNLAGLMLFGRDPQRWKPAFEIKAVAFPGTELYDTRYLDSEDIRGTLPEQFRDAMAFIRRNLRHVQGDQGFNSLGEWEIPRAALEELLVNALIHRDYFTSASIRLMVFADRLEIISPGHLPDSLTVDGIRHGQTNRRNPTLTSHAVELLPYRGLGTGISRAFEAWPHIEMDNDVAGNQFRFVVARPASRSPVPTEVTPQVNAEVAAEVTAEVTAEVERMLPVIRGEMKRGEIQAALHLKHAEHFRKAYLQPALEAGLIEMTRPDKPTSRLQTYRLTPEGLAMLPRLNTKNPS